MNRYDPDRRFIRDDSVDALIRERRFIDAALFAAFWLLVITGCALFWRL